MMKARRSTKILLGLLVILFLLGGYQAIDNKTSTENNSNQDIMNETKATAIQFFKEKYNLDVEITNLKKNLLM